MFPIPLVPPFHLASPSPNFTPSLSPNPHPLTNFTPSLSQTVLLPYKHHLTQHLLMQPHPSFIFLFLITPRLTSPTPSLPTPSHLPHSPLSPTPPSTQGPLTLSLIALYSALRWPHSFLYAFSRCTSSSRLSLAFFSSSYCPV